MDVEPDKKSTLSWGQQKKIHKRKAKQQEADSTINGDQGNDKPVGDRGYPKEFMEDSFIPLSDVTDQSINNAYNFFGFENVCLFLVS